jgi:hypothetical protein
MNAENKLVLNVAHRSRNTIVAALTVLCGITVCFCASLIDIELIASKRGCILALIGDQPLDATIPPSGVASDKSTVYITVRLPGTKITLPREEFTDFPAAGPVKKIQAVTDNGNAAVVVSLSPEVITQVQERKNNTRYLLMLSKQPFPGFIWKASQAVKITGNSLVRQRSELTDVQIIHRDATAEMVFEFNRSIEVITKKESGRLLVAFMNALSSLTQKSLAVDDDVFGPIEMSKKQTGEVPVLAFSIWFKDMDANPVVQQLPRKLTVTLTDKTPLEGFSLFSARDGHVVSRSTETQRRPIQRVSRTTGREPPAKTSTPLSTREPSNNDRDNRNELVITTDNVNVRSSPGTGPTSTVLLKLSAGTHVEEIGGKGDWKRIKTKLGIMGWVHNSLLREPTDESGAADGQGRDSSGVRKKVAYTSFGRDPFVALSRFDETELPYVENLTLVGILFDEQEKIALFEERDKSGKNIRAWSLHENDKVINGRLLRIQRREAVFLLEEMGIARTYRFSLKEQ